MIQTQRSNKKHTFLIWAAAATLLLALLLGYSHAQSTVRVAVSNVNRYYNPLFQTGGAQLSGLPLIFPGLIKNAKGVPTPYLATSWEISEDATSYTFFLHPDAVWSDGEAVTADDVKFTFTMAVNPEIVAAGGPHYNELSRIAGAEAYFNGEADEVEGIHVVDEHTVRFDFPQPNAAFMATLMGNAGVGILPQHVLEGMSVEEFLSSDFINNPDVTSGPYELVRYDPDQLLEFRKKETFWGEEPNIDQVFLLIDLVRSVAAVNLLAAGELDYSLIPRNEIQTLEQEQDIRLVRAQNVGIGPTLYFNQRNEYLADPRIRQAIAYAIDTQAIIDELFGGLGVAVPSVIIGPDWALNPDVEPYAYNPERAAELLAEAGWDSSRVLEYLVVGDPSEQGLAEVIQAYLGIVGIQVQLIPVSTSVRSERRQNGDYDMIEVAGGFFSLDPHIASTYFASDSLFGQWMGYNNPELDALFDSGNSTSDPEERQRIYWEVGRILNHDLPWIVLFRDEIVFAISDRLQNVDPPNTWVQMTWDIQNWTLTDE